jgi:hypothetical protein
MCISQGMAILVTWLVDQKKGQESRIASGQIHEVGYPSIQEVTPQVMCGTPRDPVMLLLKAQTQAIST